MSVEDGILVDPFKLKDLLKELETRKEAIAAERDKLREAQSEFEQLLEVCDRACEDLDSAIGSLSELV